MGKRYRSYIRCEWKWDTPYEARDLRGINWEFNAWGGTYDGLYADWDNDNLVAGKFMSYLGCQGYNAAPFVLEAWFNTYRWRRNNACY